MYTRVKEMNIEGIVAVKNTTKLVLMVTEVIGSNPVWA